MCNPAFFCWARKEEAARLYVVNRHLSKVKKKKRGGGGSRIQQRQMNRQEDRGAFGCPPRGDDDECDVNLRWSRVGTSAYRGPERRCLENLRSGDCIDSKDSCWQDWKGRYLLLGRRRS